MEQSGLAQAQGECEFRSMLPTIFFNHFHWAMVASGRTIALLHQVPADKMVCRKVSCGNRYTIIIQ